VLFLNELQKGHNGCGTKHAFIDGLTKKHKCFIDFRTNSKNTPLFKPSWRPPRFEGPQNTRMTFCLVPIYFFAEKCKQRRKGKEGDREFFTRWGTESASDVRPLPGRPVRVHEDRVENCRMRTTHQTGLHIVEEAQVPCDTTADDAILDQVPKPCNVL
jgi:hypothetical protein